MCAFALLFQKSKLLAFSPELLDDSGDAIIGLDQGSTLDFQWFSAIVATMGHFEEVKVAEVLNRLIKCKIS